ncbi:DUF429 domain-containing protein [Polaromonas naphthalenivorans]|uniref:DUF429 domain-containing protein n=1 Tax=Polaromonas naphthalenivorans (strain CJ2) TaxID=365044 RepID=A1VKQ3_POLNA|nr:DUF429 domain-containing protein [Polaromonas naphthalenivorans]ABM36231.1 conserved hypothetical protein [Polaromonas naphthalenivorans CJ2]
MSTPAEIPGLLIGCDFSCSPSRRKPIVMAAGSALKGRVLLSSLERLDSLDSFEQWLRQERGWIGAFDFPFGLPRELVTQLGWPTQWLELMAHYAGLSRPEIRNTFADFCDGRPVGQKFAHRATDKPAGSSPSMKWVNPPVAFMLHAGVPRLLAAGVHLPGLHPGDSRRVALEGYPGMLAREVLGSRSYKSDDKARQTPERLIARKDLITALEHGQTRLGLRLKVSHAQRDALVDDASGDSLDAVLCLMQAAWAAQQGAPGYGLPADMDALEGWIVTSRI